MQIALYKRNGSDPEALSIVFNSTNSDDKNWFSKSRIVHSPWKVSTKTTSRSRAVAMEGISTFPKFTTITRMMKDGWPLSLVIVHGKNVFLPPLFCTVTGRLTQIGIITVRFANKLLHSLVQCCKITAAS